jgi:hypothetical protein
LFKDRYDYFLIPDCRFLNEILCWIPDGWDMQSIKMIRKNFESDLTFEQKNHISETALDNYKFDYVIESENGLDKLEIEVDKFIEKLKLMKNEE